MDDFCAVCAEPLQWVAYGLCGHREVCSACTARMRVVLNDNHCCICKQECPYVFVTKSMGDYTKVVPDFTTLPSKARNAGGPLWFDNIIGAYIDDEEEFRRLRAMCRLQCSVCERASLSSNPPDGFVKMGHVFKTHDTLQHHILRVHKLVMCDLCLKGRKVFIREQKLYTKAQLERHSSEGDAFADGNEEERGGFSGHPLCAFCSKRFYSDTELYHHMSTEHYTCHICRRARPDQHDYYQNYDDLEAHFQAEHVLCEDPECLAKKFIVFRNEAEFRVHTVKEHGGNRTLSQRNAALKIPLRLQFPRDVNRRQNESLTTDGAVTARSTPSVSVEAFPPLPGTSSRRRAKHRKQVAASSTGLREALPLNTSTADESSVPEQSVVTARFGNTDIPGDIGTIDEIRAATKTVIQRIRTQVGEKQLAKFKEVHTEFKKGNKSSVIYYHQIAELGLSNIIPELARLCPDPLRQREILQVHMAQSASSASDKRNFRPPLTQNGSFPLANLKGKQPHVEESSGSNTEEAWGVPRKGKPKLSVDGGSTKGKAVVETSFVAETSSSWSCTRCTLINEASTSECAACGAFPATPDNDDKRKKNCKLSKFERMRLGSGAGRRTPTVVNNETTVKRVTGVHGAWRNGGGQHLLELSQRETAINSAWSRAK